MAKLGEAYVNIRANLSPLKLGLASARRMTMSSLRVMGRAVKIATVAMAGASIYATYAAMKQEVAEKRLAGALRMAGEYTQEAMQGLKDYAVSLQRVTTYGDESTLGLMQLAKSLGVSKGGLKDAAKMAIGLASALGRDAKSMMQYIALAKQGEFTMLRRYIPALRKTTDLTEQLAIVTAVANKGFGVEMAWALKSGSGALAQTKNAVGDVAEKFGKAFLPIIKETRTAMLNWIDKNEDGIQGWARTVGKAVKSAMAEMKEWFALISGGEWEKALQDAVKTITPMAMQLGKSIGIAMARGIREGLALTKGTMQGSVAQFQGAPAGGLIPISTPAIYKRVPATNIWGKPYEKQVIDRDAMSVLNKIEQNTRDEEF